MPAETIYLDYNATTPLDRRVRDAMLPFLDSCFGNPSSIHHVGRQARVQLDDFRDRAAKVLRCKPSELIFTSGGTESINLALQGAARNRRPTGRHLVTTLVEHHAVLHTLDYLERHEGYTVDRIQVDRCGRVDPADIASRLTPETTLVSVQAANNEVGTLQPIQEIGRLCRERGILFHTDAVQWFGKCPVARLEDFNADLVSLCSHKFHGPKGSGLLWMKSPLRTDPIIFGGGHEDERRAGTENLAGIAGLVTALELFITEPVFSELHLRPLRKKLEAALKTLSQDGVRILTPTEGSLSNTLAFVVPGSDSLTLLANLDLEGICASSGSACSVGSLNPSHVVLAMGAGHAEASALVRFSLGRETTEMAIDKVCRVLPGLIRQSLLPS